MNSKHALHLYMMMAMGLNAYDDILNKHTATVKAKLCLTCGIEHIHHNDFCSRECCFKYKTKVRVIDRINSGAACG
jgi:hypothetical protein